jgi:hypothetical protein
VKLVFHPEGIENTMLRRIFVTNIQEVLGGWRKLHNESFII